MDNITRAIHDELVLSYTQSARVVPTTVAVVAASLRDALGFADEEEVHRTFTKARDMADVPTQRVLKEALNNYRQEHRAYLPVHEERKMIESVGSMPCSNELARFFMAAQALAGLYMNMDLNEAKRIVDEFKADPKNAEVVEYERRWIMNYKKKNAKKIELYRSRGWLR